MLCPCGTEKEYAQCCELYHSGQEVPPTATSLMRSRYTAFAQLNMNYLKETNDPQTLSKFNRDYNQQWAESVNFEKLEILREEVDNNKAIVEFKAFFKIKATGEKQVHHEVSKFRKQKGAWFFREGKVHEK